jgi:hypothetical protein
VDEVVYEAALSFAKAKGVAHTLVEFVLKFGYVGNAGDAMG